MALDLSSVNAKLDRAAQHFEALQKASLPWVNEGGHRLVLEPNAKFTEHYVIYKCSKEPDLKTLSLIFGDCINTLRNALDHLIFAIGVHLSGQLPPPGWRSLAFPICKTKETFSTFRRERLSSLEKSVDILTAIELLQPYNRIHQELLPLLFLLREFNDSDKHRLLHLAVAQATEWHIHNVEGLSPQSGRWGLIPHDVPELKNDTNVATITTDGPSPNLYCNRFGLKIEIVIEHEPGKSRATHTAVEYMLDILTSEVQRAINSVVASIR